MDQHARFGGVVPEVASRAHLEAMVPVLEGAFAKAGVRPADIDAVAVTAGPGLAGALMVGVAAAKAYAYALGKPLYGVNHLAAHVAVDQLEHGPLPSPCRGAAGVRRALLAAARARRDRIRAPARRDDRRRGGRGIRQGGPGARHAVPRRPADRQGRRFGRPRGDQVPARQVPRRHAGLLIRRPEDRGGPLGGSPRATPGSRCPSRTSRRRSRRPSPTCSPERRSTPAVSTACPTW